MFWKEILIAALILFLLLSGCTYPKGPGANTENETDFVPSIEAPTIQNEEHSLKDCPFECCNSGEYTIKTCQSGFKCENSVCVSLCYEATYFENIPKQVTVPYTEKVCVDVPYLEAYQEQECHKEEVSYSTSDIVKSSYWNITEGCVVQAAIDVTNKYTNPWLFAVEFRFATSAGTIVRETTQNQIGPSLTETFKTKYDKSCFEPDPGVSFEVIAPLRTVCVMVKKYRDKTRQVCHNETKQRIETIYEKVAKTKTVCENEPDICVTLNCDDVEECTIDSCQKNGCQNSPKQNGTACMNGTCQSGKCVKQTQPQLCSYENCGGKSSKGCNEATKITTTYYCEANICKSSVSRETNSVECGYSPPPAELTTKQKVDALFEKFSEFNKLQNGATVNLYLIDEATDFTITKTSTGPQVIEGDKGSITLSLDNHIFDELYKAENVCDKLRYFTSIGLISEMNFIKNKGDPELLAEGFDKILSCFQ